MHRPCHHPTGPPSALWSAQTTSSIPTLRQGRAPGKEYRHPCVDSLRDTHDEWLSEFLRARRIRQEVLRVELSSRCHLLGCFMHKFAHFKDRDRRNQSQEQEHRSQEESQCACEYSPVPTGRYVHAPRRG